MIGAAFAEVVRSRGRDVALRVGDRAVTFAELAALAAGVRRELDDAGVGPGERVGIPSGRSAWHVAAVLGVMSHGATLVPLERSWKIAVAHVLRSGEVRGETRAPALEPAAPALALYTSGSTGAPKGVLIDHGALLARLRALAEVMPYRDGDVACLRTPLTFIDAYAEMLGPLLTGVPAVVLPDPLAISDLAHALEGGVTRLLIVPSLLARLLDVRPALPATLRLIATSGERLTAELASRVHAASTARLVNIYGSTEVAGDASWADIAPGDDVTIGCPLPGVAMRIVDGELQVSGPILARGYADDAALTAQRFAGGWFRTGDRARQLADGRYVVDGRLDGQVKIHGVRVELAEVEAALRAVAGVVDVAAAVHDGRIVAAVVAPGVRAIDPASLGLRDAATPRAIAIVPELPTTAHGKRDRAAVTAMFETPRTATTGPLAWFEKLTGSPAGLDDDFVALGGDSMARLGLLVELERAGYLLGHAGLPSPLTARALTAVLASYQPAGAPRPASSVTDFQRVIVLDSLANRGTPIWLEQLAYTLHADIDAERFAKAWQDEVDAQPALRTRFVIGDDVVQEVVAGVAVPFEVIEATQVKAEEWRRISRCFDLSAAPLFEVCLVRGADRCDVIFTYHHAILDGESARTVLRHVLARYAGHGVPGPAVASTRRGDASVLRDELAGFTPPALPAPERARGDLLWWLFHALLAVRSWFARRRVEKHAVDLPLRHRPSVYAGGDVTSQPVPKLVDDAVAAWARARGVTATTVWATAFALHLARERATRDVVFGMMFSGRDGASATAIGMFATCLPVRVRIEGDLVRDVGATLARLERAGDVPLFELGLDPHVWLDTMMTSWRFPASEPPAVPATNGRGLSMYAPHTAIVVSDRELAAGARDFHRTDRVRRDVLGLVEAIVGGASTEELLACRIDEGGMSIAQPRL